MKTAATYFRDLHVLARGFIDTSPFGRFLGRHAEKGTASIAGGGPIAGGPDGGCGSGRGTIASGLKDALAVGTKNAVSSVSKLNGYFGNAAIKILLPDNIQKAAELLGKMGYQKQVDDFILSMNRAAEKAAPKAASYFADAIRGMSIEDARKILSGGNTAATEYFKTKTSSKLYAEFKPSVSDSMNQVGVARAYNGMMAKVPAVPLPSPNPWTWTTMSPRRHWTASSIWWGRKSRRSAQIPPPAQRTS